MTHLYYFIGSAIVFFSTGSGPAYTQAYKFNDTGGSGGGDRNSMYLPTMYAPTIPWSSY